jgi:hypothetical protein
LRRVQARVRGQGDYIITKARIAFVLNIFFARYEGVGKKQISHPARPARIRGIRGGDPRARKARAIGAVTSF